MEKSGNAERLLESADGDTIPVLSDHETRLAIQELNRSTESISKQTEVLKQQQDALSRLVKGIQSNANSRAALESRQAQNKESAQRSMAWTVCHLCSPEKTLSWFLLLTEEQVEELSQNLQLRINELEHGKHDTAGLPEMVTSILRSDDKLLSSLQKLGRELTTEDPKEQERLQILRENSARLIKYVVEGIRTKLDRLYLESLESSPAARRRDDSHPDDIAAIQEELESLYAEILPVAQMSAEQQYLEPAFAGLAAKNGSSLLRSEKAVDYVGHIHKTRIMRRLSKSDSLYLDPRLP